MAYTAPAKIPQVVDNVRKAFATGKSKDINWRISQIQNILKLVEENRKDWQDALAKDLGVGDFWVHEVELEGTVGECKVALANIKKWAAPEPVTTPLVLQLGNSSVQREPFGVVLIIAPWNYPLSLVLNPMVAALAAGNAVVYKPSEISSHTSALIQKLLPKYLDAELVQGVYGGAEETQILLKQRFDFICYTGNTEVGKVVMRAAAEHLTPVLLELGGKCPAIVDDDANIEKAVKRIAWGKWSLNMGQTCLSPDYIICTKKVESKIIAQLKTTLAEFFGSNPKESKDVSRIINERHAQRIAALLEDKELKIEVGDKEQIDVKNRYIPPIVVRCSTDAKIMQNEIFGPILPVITVDSVARAIDYINSREKPLGLYVFTENTATQRHILNNTSSGGASVNDCVVQGGTPFLPFGGVGHSGMGHYHGKHGFDAFSHKKSIFVKKGTDPALRFPPYTSNKLAWLKRLRSFDPARLVPVLVGAAVVATGAVYKYYLP